MRATFKTYHHQDNRLINTHTIDLIDTQGSLTGEFEIDFSGGFEQVDEGLSRSAWQTIQGRTFSFTMYIETDAHMSFVDALKRGEENRFQVKHKGGQTEFNGVVITNGMTLVSGPKVMRKGQLVHNAKLQVTAIDGVTLLKNIPFPLPGSDGDPDRLSIGRILLKCFELMPTYSLISGPPLLFLTNWTADTGGFINEQYIDRKRFVSINRDGGLIPMSCFEVITEICLAFDLRCYYYRGRYAFEQLGSLEAGATADSLGQDGTFTTGAADVSVPSDVDNIFRYAIAPDIRSYEPPLREVVVRYNSKFHPNLAAGKSIDSASLGTIKFNDLAILPIKNAVTRLRVVASVEYTAVITGGFTGQVRPIFWFWIKIGDQYFTRVPVDSTILFQGGGGYLGEEWTTTEDNYYEVPSNFITLPDSENVKFFLPIFFSTLPIPQSLDGETLSVGFGHDVIDENNQQVFESNLAVRTIVDDLDVSIIDKENNIVEQVALVTRLSLNENNSKGLEREILFSTGPTETAEGRITDASETLSVDWTAPNIGTYPHYELLARSIAARGINPQEYLETEIRGAYDPLSVLSYCGIQWRWMRGSFIIAEQTERYVGEFLAIANDPAPAITATLEEVYDHLQRPTKESLGSGQGNKAVKKEATGLDTNTISAATYKIPMPNTANWSKERIASAVDIYKDGIFQRYHLGSGAPSKVDTFDWDNVNRNFRLGENADPRETYTIIVK